MGSLHREFLPENIHHKRGCIVAAGGCDCLTNERRSRISRCVAQDILDVDVEEAIGHAIHAEQKPVARLETYGAHLGFDQLQVCAEDFLLDIAFKVTFRLALVDLTISKKPADIGEIQPARTFKQQRLSVAPILRHSLRQEPR